MTDIFADGKGAAASKTTGSTVFPRFAILLPNLVPAVLIENPVPKHILNSICDTLKNDKDMFSKYTSDSSDNPDALNDTIKDLLKFLWAVSHDDLCSKLSQTFSPTWNIQEINAKCVLQYTQLPCVHLCACTGQFSNFLFKILKSIEQNRK